MGANVADDMGGMKRLALASVALGVMCFGALAGGSAQAQQPSYPPGLNLTLVAVPDEVQTNAAFDAVLTGCFPGETVTFVNFVPFQLEQAICDDITYTASVEFTASSTTGTRFIAASIPPLNSTDPDVPSLPPRAIFATYSVVTTLVIGPITDANDGDQHVRRVTAEFGRLVAELPLHGDPSHLPRSPCTARRDLLRSWRGDGADDEEEQSHQYPGRIIPPTDPPKATIA